MMLLHVLLICIFYFILGLLKKNVKGKCLRCIQNEKEAEEVYHSAHVTDLGHAGINRTVARIYTHFFFKGATEYVTNKV